MAKRNTPTTYTKIPPVPPLPVSKHSDPLVVSTHMVHVLTRWDRKQHARKGAVANPYALSITMATMADVVKDHLKGATWAQALYDHFTGELLAYIEKSMSLPYSRGGRPGDHGRPKDHLSGDAP